MELVLRLTLHFELLTFECVPLNFGLFTFYVCLLTMDFGLWAFYFWLLTFGLGLLTLLFGLLTLDFDRLTLDLVFYVDGDLHFDVDVGFGLSLGFEFDFDLDLFWNWGLDSSLDVCLLVCWCWFVNQHGVNTKTCNPVDGLPLKPVVTWLLSGFGFGC